jgi:hypothetical protein
MPTATAGLLALVLTASALAVKLIDPLLRAIVVAVSIAHPDQRRRRDATAVLRLLLGGGDPPR